MHSRPPFQRDRCYCSSTQCRCMIPLPCCCSFTVGLQHLFVTQACKEKHTSQSVLQMLIIVAETRRERLIGLCGIFKGHGIYFICLMATRARAPVDQGIRLPYCYVRTTTENYSITRKQYHTVVRDNAYLTVSVSMEGARVAVQRDVVLPHSWTSPRSCSSTAHLFSFPLLFKKNAHTTLGANC